MFILHEDQWYIADTKSRGRGVFARCELSPGTVIGDYTGKLIHYLKDDPEQGLYSLLYSDELVVIPLDYKQPGVHVINHACMPNCGLYPYEDRMLIVALRKIFPDEELTFEYLLDPPEDEDADYPCFCGTPLCRGTMHVSREVATRFSTYVMEQGNLYQHPAGKEGDILEPLAHYPDHMPDHPVYDLLGNLEHEPLVMDDEKLPDTATIRQTIRESGLCLAYPKLGYRVLGFFQQHLVLYPLP